MAFLVLFARKMSLKNQVNDLNYKLMQKQQELQDLQAYTAAIADGEVTMNELTTTPASMFGRMSQYMVASHNYAYQAAQFNYAQFGGAYAQQMQAQQGQAQQGQAPQYDYQAIVFNNLYQQQKQQFVKAEQEQLHIKEKAMENEKLKLEQQLKMMEAELQTIDESINKGIKDSAPQYA
ncbi:hypothetical protein IKE67_02865 [bacterium]|nr:hypothetical protein [bacterium]